MPKYKRDYRLYIDDILEAIRKIEEYTQGLSFREFARNSQVVDGIIRNFEVIGEAAKHIPVSIRKRYPDIPWKEMAGMRNKLVHEYFGVNEQILWKTIKEDLEILKPKITQILEDLSR